MRIGINTNIDYSNYGNRLQNFALQTVLEDLGNEVITIKNYTDVSIGIKKKIKNSMENGTFFSQIIKILKRNKKSDDNTKSNDVRIRKFLEFTDKYINESDFILNESTTDFSFDNDIDCYVIGSDQVWNYNFSDRFSTYDFVEYSTKPKISYAASFGISRVPKSYVSIYKKGLREIDHISVRETEGQKIVYELTKRNAELVLDPTMLLKREDWLSLVSNKVIYQERYLLTYFLGNISKTDYQYIDKFARDRNLSIKKLGDSDVAELWETDPIDFINLVSQSSAIFTDSFHGTVFSIIFNKYFEVFSRKEYGQPMNSRLETLLDTFNLTSQWHSENNSKPIDYDKVGRILRTKRKDSLNYLRMSLSDVSN